MALADWNAFVAQQRVMSPPCFVVKVVSNQAILPSEILAFDTWYGSPDAGANPLSNIAPDRTTPGAWPNIPQYSNTFISGVQMYPAYNRSVGFGNDNASRFLVVYDRLSQCGGNVDGTINTLQTTQFPTAALTRYTSGDGVVAFLETTGSWSGTGTPRIGTMTYTNQAGTGSRVGTVAHTMTHTSNSRGLFPIGLQSGDTGIRSVESFQWSAAGNSGSNGAIFLAKPLAILVAKNDREYVMANQIVGWNNVISPDACLCGIVPQANTGVSHAFALQFGDMT